MVIAEGSARGDRRLRAAVRRALAWRVIAAAVAISLLLGAVIWFRLADEVGDEVVQLVLHRTELFNATSEALLDQRGLSDPAELRAAFARFQARYPPTPESVRFVLGRLYDTEGVLVVEVRPETGEPAAGAGARLTDFHRPFAGSRHQVVRLAAGPAVLVQAPLSSSDRVVGSIDGAFLLGPETVAAGRRRILSVVLYVAGVALLTALLLYPLLAELVRRLARASTDLLSANLETLQVLGEAVAKRDTDTQAHSCRVTIYAARLAEAAGFSDAALRRLIKGALVHDVGKVAIRDEILLKPGKLSDEEFEVMKTHVVHGEDIVRRCAWLEDAADVVRYHHERYDGGGYMQGLAGEEIPIAARIFAIADVFDALTSKRPYHEPRSLEATMELIWDGSGSHFDPSLVATFAEIVPELHERFAGRDDPRLRDQLSAVVRRYHTGGLGTLEVSSPRLELRDQ